MKVNQNISAVISNAQLHRTEDKLTASIERLSSGFKLNKAKDNPAGMAISYKMRAQINALDQSSSNAADGTSVLQTADGALTEIHSMLQRMRELSVQAATDTMTPDDKQACQDEVEKLQEEIDRIARDTEFNGKRLLDGSQDYRMFPSVEGNLAGTYICNFQTSDEVMPQNYALEVTQVAEQAKASVNITVPGEHKIDFNGTKIEIEATDSPDDVYTKLKEAGETAGVKVVETAAGSYDLTSFDYGKKAKISFIADGNELIDHDNGEGIGKDTEINILTDLDDKRDINGNYILKDANGDLIKVIKNADGTYSQVDENGAVVGPATGDLVPYGEGFQGQEIIVKDAAGNPVMDPITGKPQTEIVKTATYLSDGMKVTIKDLNGFEMIFEVDPEQDMEGVLGTVPVLVDLEMTDLGSMTLQVGAHENQIVDVRIPAVDCEALFIDDLNLVRNGKADEAMEALDDAIAQVSDVRSRIGAYQNRLDYAVKSLDGTVENMEAAISRIMDTDMAEEMSTYSNMNVLDQAAISVLTQANDMPQQILQLLQ